MTRPGKVRTIAPSPIDPVLVVRRVYTIIERIFIADYLPIDESNCTLRNKLYRFIWLRLVDDKSIRLLGD